MLKIKNNLKLYQLYSANALSEIGDVFYYVALITYASTLKNSALAISLVTSLEYVPPILSILFGKLADQFFNKSKVAMYVNLLQCGLYILNGIWFTIASRWILLILCLLTNFCSDTIDLISQEVEPVILKKLSPKISFEKKYGLLNSISQFFSVFGKFLGGIIITAFNEHYVFISIINAITFGIAALMLFRIGDVIIKFNNIENNIDFKMSFFLKEHPQIKYIILLMANINIVLAPVLPIIYIMLSHKYFYSPFNYATSVSTLTAIDSVASILGPILGLKFFNGSKALINALLWCSSLSIIFSLSIISNNFYVVGITLFFASFFAGASMPLLYGKLINDIPENRLGIINGFVDSVLAITPPIAIFFFSSAIQYLPTITVVGVLCIFSIILTAIIIIEKSNFINKNEN